MSDQVVVAVVPSVEDEIVKAKALLEAHGLVVAPLAPAAPDHCKAICAVLKVTDLARCASRAITGLRTFLFFGISLGLGFAEELGGIDITPALQMVLPEGSKVSVSQAVILMSIAGILLRAITRTPAFTRWRSAARAGNDGMAPGVGTGSVDEPEIK